MGAKFVAAAIGVIIVVVLGQTLLFGGDDGVPSITRPGSIPTATPPAGQDEPTSLGTSDAGGGQSAPGPTNTSYTVQPGDTLGAIAGLLGVPADEQVAWTLEVLSLNGMDDPRQLQAGQELILPGFTASSGPDDSAEATATPPTSATGTTPTGPGGTYTIVAGDYPFLIATNHCVDDPEAWVADLLDINAINPTSLAIGLVLDLPPGTPAYCGEGNVEPTPQP